MGKEEERGDPAEEGESSLVDLSLPACPPLNRPPFTKAEVESLFEDALDHFPNGDALLDEVEATGAQLIDLVYEASPEEFPEDLLAYAVTLLVPIWFVMVPPRHRAPAIDTARIAQGMEKVLLSFGRDPSQISGKDYKRVIVDGSRQPELMNFAASHLVMGFNDLPSDLAEYQDEASFFVILLRALIDELDAVRRRL